MELIKSVYRKLLSFRFRLCISKLRIKLHLIPAENQRLQKIKTGMWMETHKEECEYMLKSGEALVFPYSWTKEHKANDIEVCFDREKHMYYVMVHGRRMYFPRSFSKLEIRVYFNSILTEQDSRSPHYYFNPSDEKLRGSTFFDIGGAEGYITLMVLPFVKDAVIFECDGKWTEALDATFEPYHNKVKIIHQLVGAETSRKGYIRIDDVTKDRRNVVLKIDVDGMEKEVLSGAVKTLDKADTKVYVCTYHKKNDEKELGEMLRRHGFQIQVSDGWMYFGGADASFRRGIIRAEKRVN